MLRQVIAPHEAFLTLAALEAFVTCNVRRNKRECTVVFLKGRVHTNVRGHLCASERAAATRRCA